MASRYKQKLEQALAEVAVSGLSRASTFPPLLRGLCGIGLPVRPLHYMSTLGLVTFLFLALAAMFLALHWLASSLEVNAWAVNKLRQLGVAGAVSAGAVCALGAAIITRFQAITKDLTAWRDL